MSCGAYNCFACGFPNVTEDQHSGSRIPRNIALVLYEHAVETIEIIRGPFTIASAWKLARGRSDGLPKPCNGYGWGPTLDTYVRYAVRDMASHGLIECIKRDHNGRRCLLWIKIEERGKRS